MVRRFWSRLFDHRVWIVGIGFLAFASSIILFMVLPQQLQPTINRDNSQVKYELPPGSTLEQSEEMVRQTGAILDNSSVVETALSDVDDGGRHACIKLQTERPISEGGRVRNR